MRCTALFHAPPDSVTSPEATLSGVLSGETSGDGLGEADEATGVEADELRLALVSSASFVAGEQATNPTQASKMIAHFRNSSFDRASITIRRAWHASTSDVLAWPIPRSDPAEHSTVRRTKGPFGSKYRRHRLLPGSSLSCALNETANLHPLFVLPHLQRQLQPGARPYGPVSDQQSSRNHPPRTFVPRRQLSWSSQR